MQSVRAAKPSSNRWPNSKPVWRSWKRACAGTLSAGRCFRVEEQQLSPAASRVHRRLQYHMVLGLIMPLPAA